MSPVRPTGVDLECLDELLAVGKVPRQAVSFLEGLQERYDAAEQAGADPDPWTPKQCAWFDDLCARHL